MCEEAVEIGTSEQAQGETGLVSTAVKLLVYKGTIHGLLKKHFLFYCPILIFWQTPVKPQQGPALPCPVWLCVPSVCSCSPLPWSLVTWGWLAAPGHDATGVINRAQVTPLANVQESSQATAQPGLPLVLHLVWHTFYRKVWKEIGNTVENSLKLLCNSFGKSCCL